jgi:hypothetical protein
MSVGDRIAIALAVLIVLIVMLELVQPDPLDTTEDDDEPADARAWRDPWGDVQ